MASKLYAVLKRIPSSLFNIGQHHPASYLLSKLSVCLCKSWHHEVIVMRNFCERNSFGHTRFRLQ